MHFSKDRKALTIALTCLAALALIAILVFSWIRERQKIASQREYEAIVATLEKERADLLMEYSTFEGDVYASLGCAASLSLVFNGVDRALYDDIFPIVEYCEGSDGAFDGIICLSPDDMPGMEGKITPEELSELIDAGWTVAVCWYGDEDLGEYIASMKLSFASLGIPEFDTVLFWGMTYDASYDNVLMTHGVDYALQSNSRYPVIEQRTEGDTLLIPGYVGWNNPDDKGAKYVYEYLCAKGGVSAFVINFPDSNETGYRLDGTIDYIPERKDGFTRLVRDNLLPRYLEDKLIVGDFDSAFRMRESYNEAALAVASTIEAKKAELLRKIAEVDEKIIEAYFEYIGG